MQTSYFGNLKKIPTGLRPVGIAVGSPPWYKGERELRLAPTRAMLKMSKDDYNREFDAILAKLDPVELAQSLGDNAVLLCWEKPFEACHRRRVAEWFEAALGIQVTELGFDRSVVPAYAEMEWKTAGPKTPKPRKGPVSQQLLLF